MIKKFASFIAKKVFIPKSERVEQEKEVETQTSLLQKKAMFHKTPEPSPGIPAPPYLSEDPWFGAPTLSEKNKDVVQKESEIKQQHEENKKELVAAGIIIEDENIHQKMYDMATKNWNTVAETQGGSENFQEGPGGWNSGNGFSRVSG